MVGIKNIDADGVIEPGETVTAIVTARNEASPGPSTDSCNYSLFRGGIGHHIEATLAGESLDSGSVCVPAYFTKEGTGKIELNFTLPSDPGTYTVRFVDTGTTSGKTLDDQTVDITVEDTSNPATSGRYYPYVQDLPESVGQDETFSFTCLAICGGGDCDTADYEIELAGEVIDSGTIEFVENEETRFTVGPDEIWINDTGSHTAVFRVGTRMDSDSLEVTETDPPQYPSGGGGDGGPDVPSESNTPLAVAALAGAAAGAILDDELEEKS